MREIKFRAYIKPLKRYAKNYETILYYHQCNMEPTWTVNLISGEYYDEKSLIIEQDTGLKDKNGKEIYEGDIVKSYNGSDAVKNNKHTITEVKRDNFYTGFCPMNRDENADFNRNLCEVIGNIHENLELLEKK